MREDLAAGVGEVYRPDALASKYPSAPRNAWRIWSGERCGMVGFRQPALEVRRHYQRRADPSRPKERVDLGSGTPGGSRPLYGQSVGTPDQCLSSFP
jgi:hypothetical protein